MKLRSSFSNNIYSWKSLSCIIRNMSVDKFGRYETTVRRAALRGPPGVGFKTTAEGDYDIRAKRLRMVGEPKDVNDAVTLNYVNRNCLRLKKRVNKDQVYFDADKRAIRNLKEPIESNDAVNKAYIDRRTPVRGEGEWNFSNLRLNNIAEPMSNTDAVNKAFLDRHTPMRIKDEWNFNNMRLSNLAEPRLDTDAVNKAFLDRQAPIRGKDEWNFSNMRLSNVAEPKESTDGVNLSFLVNRVVNPLTNLQRSTLALDTEKNAYDAKGKVITNMLDAVVDDDAVNLRLLNAFRETVDKRFNDVWEKVEDEMSSMAYMVVSRINDATTSYRSKFYLPSVKQKPWSKNFEDVPLFVSE